MRYVRSCYEGYIWSKLYVCAVCIRDCMVQICVRMVLWYMNVMHVIGVTKEGYRSYERVGRVHLGI